MSSSILSSPSVVRRSEFGALYATAGSTIGKVPFLGGLTPASFMQRHWQKKPLLVRQAFSSIISPITPEALFALAGQDNVESRVVERPAEGSDGVWSLTHGPFRKRDLPSVNKKDWTLLVQGVNLHVPAAHELLAGFRFIPAARLDDLMVSWASEGGGVGPHFDSYDVFLIQTLGQRRWRIGRAPEARMLGGQPLKLIDGFEYEQEWVLSPGDMLYLPPGWAHDGDAVGGECMTCSVGFRAPQAEELNRELLDRLAQAQDDAIQDAEERACEAHSHQGTAVPRHLYQDADQSATATPGRIPVRLQAFARKELLAAVRAPGWIERALGEYLSEPKPGVDFTSGTDLTDGAGVSLHSKTSMLYDEHHVFINGESLLAAGADATVLQRLSDRRCLTAEEITRASAAVREVLEDWTRTGWLCQQSA